MLRRERMDMSVWDVIVAVLKNIYVIIAVVAVVLYLNFVNYIISYRKRPKPPKQKKVAQSFPASKNESSETEEEGYEDGGDVVD